MKKTLLFVVALVAAVSMNAQRNVDMQTTLLSPANGSIMRSGFSVPFSFNLKNLGPDTIKAGDTALVTWYHNGTATTVAGGYVFPKDMVKDSSITLFFQNNIVITGGQAGSFQECAVGVLYNRGANGVLDTATTSGSNNRGCNTITYSVGIEEVLGGDQAVKMYPNPVNTFGTITYNLKDANTVSVKIFDIAGRLVSTVFEGAQEAGEQTLTFDATQLSSGVYFYTLQIGDLSTTSKMIVE